jgi:lipoprotein-anchoring transpeptidase ErfK/SrfK
MARERKHSRHRGAKRSIVVVIALAGTLTMLGGGAAYAGYRYDQGRTGRILPGIRIDGIAVGGMTRTQAEQALQRVAAKVLDHRVTVTAGSQVWHLTSRTMGTTVDLTTAVDGAFAASHQFPWWQRAWHWLMNKPVDRTFTTSVAHDRSPSHSLAQSIVAKVATPPHDASRDYVNGHLVTVPSKAGTELLNAKKAEAAIFAAVSGARSVVHLGVRQVEPAVTEQSFGKLIVVRLSQNMLYLYDGFHLVKSYQVATGQPSIYPTPEGHFEIINKRVNPTWVNPQPNGWGKNEPAVIPPGPDNPLGTRALDLSAPGIRIHGTPDNASIGHWASHGCIRMHIWDSEDLYPRVDVGTPVIITQ